VATSPSRSSLSATPAMSWCCVASA
jgi:hypothetical protein